MTILTGIVVIVALSVGAVVVAESTGEDAGPTTDLLLEVSAENVTISHNGGDSVALANLRVTIKQGNTRSAFTPDVANTTGPDDRLDPGERIRREHGFGAGDLEVIVAHRPSSTILLDDLKRIRS